MLCKCEKICKQGWDMVLTQEVNIRPKSPNIKQTTSI